MPSTTFTVSTSLAPDRVLTLLTDFGPGRAERWPNIDAAHFEVHEVGDGWAEVTEGNKMGWERERYSWDATAGTVSVDTLESNLWAAGNGWRYVLTPSGAGTVVQVTLTRTGRSVPGKLIGALIPIAGARTLTKQLESVLRSAEQG